MDGLVSIFSSHQVASVENLAATIESGALEAATESGLSELEALWGSRGSKRSGFALLTDLYRRAPNREIRERYQRMMGHLVRRHRRSFERRILPTLQFQASRFSREMALRRARQLFRRPPPQPAQLQHSIFVAAVASALGGASQRPNPIQAAPRGTHDRIVAALSGGDRVHLPRIITVGNGRFVDLAATPEKAIQILEAICAPLLANLRRGSREIREIDGRVVEKIEETIAIGVVKREDTGGYVIQKDVVLISVKLSASGLSFTIQLAQGIRGQQPLIGTYDNLREGAFNTLARGTLTEALRSLAGEEKWGLDSKPVTRGDEKTFGTASSTDFEVGMDEKSSWLELQLPLNRATDYDRWLKVFLEAHLKLFDFPEWFR